MTIRVTVVYALPHEQRVIDLDLQEGATAAEAVAASGIASAIPGGLPVPIELGTWGAKVAPDARLRDGDRVEIYRPLVADPKQARRERAKDRPLRRRPSR